jgi:sorting nexin-29
MAIICPIFKKGDPTEVENYRGISLLDTNYKILSLTILNRLEKYASVIIGEYQSGFIRGRLTTNHIFTIRQIMKKYYEYNKEFHIVLVNFKQAYDSINRDQLWIALTNLGVPNKLIKIIKICNSNKFYKVQ